MAKKQTNQETIAAMMAQIEALTAQNAKLAAAAAAAAETVEAEEVTIAGLDQVAGDVKVEAACGRLTQYAAATMDIASSTIGARGLAVVRPAPDDFSLAHRRAAKAMQAAGYETGDGINGRDAERIAPFYQDDAGFPIKPSSLKTAFAKWADAGWLTRVGGGVGKRASGYIVADKLWYALAPASCFKD